MNTALKERQQRLADGLNFLNNQAPELEKKTTELQNDLVTFRMQNSLLEPIIEGGNLKDKENELRNKIMFLQAEKK